MEVARRGISRRLCIPNFYSADLPQRWLGRRPNARWFRLPYLGGYVDAERHIAVRLTPANHYPIEMFGRRRATRKNCAQRYERFSTYLHVMADLPWLSAKDYTQIFTCAFVLGRVGRVKAVFIEVSHMCTQEKFRKKGPQTTHTTHAIFYAFSTQIFA